MQVSASLLAADLASLGQEVRRAERAGVRSFHFDVMDGHYVPNIALSLEHLAKLRPHTALPFHVHLELANPDHVLEDFQPFEADSISVCLDTLPDPRRTFSLIRSRRAQVGLSLDPGDSTQNASRWFPELDLLIVLGVFPGFGGQAMHPETPERLAHLWQLRDDMDLHFTLAVDGGVTMDNAPALVRAGADMLIIGTALFHAPHMVTFMKRITAAARL
ncbi:MAG TPA: ribulose-phosphate 3-epimerase [Anaerolineales bacterium]|nr:ribulose-phosphate 3-epimerase [Anaerolineales bacterium]